MAETTRRRVFLDPDGTLPHLLGVILICPTGVTYEPQCAGIETVIRAVERYFVPLVGLRFVAEEGAFEPDLLTQVFHHEGACRWGGRGVEPAPGASHLPQDRLHRLKARVAAIPFWTTHEAGADHRERLQLDEARLEQLREAWVPVLTPEGPGVLVWKNCD